MPTEKRIYTMESKPIRNASREPDLLVRMCNNCFRVYKGNGRICPYCQHDNGKTKKQIEEDEKAELERVTEIHRKQARMEVGMARTEQELIDIGIKRGYKNPRFWAKKIMENRKRKV